MTKKPGRPPRVGKRPADIRVTIRLTKAEFAAWRRCASAAGMTLSEWLRSCVPAACSP